MHTIQIKPLLLSSNEDVQIAVILYDGDIDKLKDTVKRVISKKGNTNFKVEIKPIQSKLKMRMSGSASSGKKSLKIALEEVEVYYSNINKRMKFSTTR
jgi:hypothetical protein